MNMARRDLIKGIDNADKRTPHLLVAVAVRL